MGGVDVGPTLDQLLNFGWYIQHESNDVGPTINVVLSSRDYLYHRRSAITSRN